MGTERVTSPANGVTVSPSDAPTDCFYTVRPAIFILLSLSTYGIYAMYWMYRNWHFIKHARVLKVQPFWRAFFAPVCCLSMASHVKRMAFLRSCDVALNAPAVGLGYLALNMVWRLPDPYWLIGLSSFVPLLFLLAAMHRINEHMGRDTYVVSRFNWKHIAVIVLGAVVFVLALVAMSIPEISQS
jgi:hypothetical protein